MRNSVAVTLFSLGLTGCFDDTYDQNRYVHTGEEAKGQILKWAHSAIRLGEHGGSLPASSKNFWLFDGGSFGGSITYWLFDCDSRDDCLKAVKYLGDLQPANLKPWEPSHFAVVMGGLDFYSRKGRPAKALKSNPWDVRGIKNGVVYEHVRGKDRGMVYYAIDFDRNRVYYHYESGGFPTDAYDPEAPTTQLVR